MQLYNGKRGRGRPRQVTQKQIDTIIELRKQNKGYSDIGRAVNLSRFAVRYYVVRWKNGQLKENEE